MAGFRWGAAEVSEYDDAPAPASGPIEPSSRPADAPNVHHVRRPLQAPGHTADHLNERLRGQECDGTMRNVRAFLADQGLDVSQTLRWLRERGAYCDCGVVTNVR